MILRPNNVGDPVGNVNAITLATPTATTATWPAAPLNMPTVASPDILKIIAEPNTTHEEIMYVTAYTSGATSATVTRAQEGTAGIAHSAVNWVCGPTNLDFASQVYSGPTAPSPRGEYTLWVNTSATPAGAVWPGMVLASARFAPGTLAGYTLTTTLAAPDPTNLTISFVGPPSGNVILQANVWGRLTLSTTVGQEAVIQLCFLSHGTTTVVSPVQRVFDGVAITTAASWVGGCGTYRALVTGLTPGTTYQYDLGAWYAVTGGSGAGGTLYADNGALTSGTGGVGPTLLTVEAA
jgi:hypothetical protein